MAFTDRAAQSAECAVAGDKRGQRLVRTFDHTGMPEVGQLTGPAGDIADEGLQRTG